MEEPTANVHDSILQFEQGRPPSECDDQCRPACEGSFDDGFVDNCQEGWSCTDHPSECPCDLPEFPTCIGVGQPGADERGCAP